jgi:hypothetical protein
MDNTASPVISSDDVAVRLAGTTRAGEQAMNKKILVIGHSHMNALTPIDGLEETFDFITFPIAEGAYQKRDRAELVALAATDYASVVFMLGGSRHIALGMLNPPQDPFDFYLPEERHLPFDKQARPLPVDVVTSLLKRHMARDFDDLVELSGIFSGHRRYHVESPPPCPAEHILAHPAGFAELLRERGLAPTAVRYKFWRLHSRLMREFCAAQDIHFVAAPAGTQDADGCLTAPYLRTDPAHANSAYGVQVVRQLRALNGHVA